MHNRKRPIIDAQVHTYERDHPGRPWQGFLVGPASALVCHVAYGERIGRALSSCSHTSRASKHSRPAKISMTVTAPP